MPIKLLADDVTSQIAAGEVIERPSSVIKELVENSLDSGAKKIEVRLRGSGQPFIEVFDDGYGIPRDELVLAVTRHATSKLNIAEDLFHITTLGFRGEALASIGSVSHLTIESTSTGSELGSKINVEAGRIINQQTIHASSGTMVRVENLFYNLSARLKFLKKDNTERQSNLTFLSKYATAYPQVQFQIWQDDLQHLRTSGSGDPREVFSTINGLELGKAMLDVSHSDWDIQVSGFTSPISLTRSNRREITFFVNGRWVQDISLSTALLQAYHTYLMVGRYPISTLFISLPPEEVDVNVHPAKAEVRFHNPDQIFSVIQRAIRKALLLQSPVVEIQTERAWQSGITSQSNQFETGSADTQPIIMDQLSNPAYTPAQTTSQPQSVFPGLVPLLRLVGQVGSAYLVAEGPDGLYLIDQHAAHERILFEKYSQLKRTELPSQRLLESVVTQLTPGQAVMIDKELDIIKRMGYDIEPFGQNSFICRAIPSIFSKLSVEQAIRVLVEDFEEDESPLQTELEAKLVARICKRAAVKAGQTLSGDEQKQLVNDLQQCISPRTCPHGRPTMIHLSVDLLERQFGRRGAR